MRTKQRLSVCSNKVPVWSPLTPAAVWSGRGRAAAGLAASALADRLFITASASLCAAESVSEPARRTRELPMAQHHQTISAADGAEH